MCIRDRVHSVEDFQRMVGNGIPKLVERFAPEGTGAPVLEQALGEFMAWYGVHKADQTAPYPGMLQEMCIRDSLFYGIFLESLIE